MTSGAGRMSHRSVASALHPSTCGGHIMSTANSHPRVWPAGPAREPASARHRQDRRDEEARSRLVQRVLAEFREMPCLRLTADQAQRLFGLRPDVSRRIMDRLIEQGHVRIDADGRYAGCDPT